MLNSNGEIVRTCWAEIANHFNDIDISEYVIMPNHFHGIIIINDSVKPNPIIIPPVAARHAVPHTAGRSNPSTISTQESFGKPVVCSLPTIVRSFKSAVTKQINLREANRRFPFWQKGYYEHIIRSEEELVLIGEYVLGNPMKWEADRENPDSLNPMKASPFEY